MAYHKEDLKNRIVEVAFDLGNELGYNNISTRMIAKELDVSAAAIYRHYKDVAALSDAILAHGEEQFSSYLLLNLDTSKSECDQIVSMALSHLQFCMDFPHFYDLMFFSEHAPRVSREQILVAKSTKGMESFLAALNAIVYKTDIEANVDDLVIKIWIFLQGYAYLVRYHNFEIDEELISSSIHSLLEGVYE